MIKNSINYWASGIVPVIRGTNLVSNASWCHTDNVENFNKNPNKDKWKDIDITYKFNKQQFRTHDLPSLFGQKVDVALGCSFTLGVGLADHMTWPASIEKQSKFPMLNLGVGGGSTDTVARVLTNIGPLYDIQTVYILWPQLGRFERYTSLGTIECMVPNRDSVKIEYVWNMEATAANQRFFKNQSIVHNLAKLHRFSVIETFADNVLVLDWARDGVHPGPRTNALIANKFMNEQNTVDR